MTSNKIRSITTFILIFFLITSSKSILLLPSQAEILNKIAYTGFKCDFTDEHAKFQNAFFIWIDKDNYKLIGLDENHIIVLNYNSYKLEDKYLLKLKLFWGNRTLIINTNSLRFGNYKKGKCTTYSTYDELTNSLLNCKNNSCDHN